MIPNDSILIKECQECGNKVQIWKTHGGTILGIRCPSCFVKWKDKNKLLTSGLKR